MPTTSTSSSASRSWARWRSTCTSDACERGAAVADRIVKPEEARASDDVLRVEHVAKRFGPVTALRDVNLHLRKGEVLGLLGDNGAGKSTLMKIIAGFQNADSGRIVVKGEEVTFRDVDHARSLGIDCVYQDLALVNELDVVQNMFLKRELVSRPVPLLARRKMRRLTREALDQIGINIPRLDLPVARLFGGQRQGIP